MLSLIGSCALDLGAQIAPAGSAFRQGWDRTAVTSLAAFALAYLADANAESQGTPAPSWFVLLVIVLGALAIVGIVAVVVDTVLLRRRPPARARRGLSRSRHRAGQTARSGSRREVRRGALNVGSGQYAPVMANFAVRLVHGPGWDPSRQIRDQDGWDEHAAFMDGLVDDGFIILGGPVGDGEQALHAVEAADENEIRARLDRDPWAAAGLLEIGMIEPWALWLDSRPANRAL